MKKCPKCGTENPDEAEFCKKCGAKLEEAIAQSKLTTTINMERQVNLSLVA